MPVVVHKVLFVGSETGATHIMANRTVVHVDTILHTVGGHGRRLLLGRAEAVCRLGERVLGRVLLDGADEAVANHVIGIVGAGTGLRHLAFQIHLEMTQLFAHCVVGCASSRAEALLVGVTVRAREVLLLLFEDLVDVELLHGGAGHAEGVGVGAPLRLRVNLLVCRNIADATLVLLVLLVTEAVLPDSEPEAVSLLGAEFFRDLIAEGVRRELGRREARCLAEGKLLLR